MASKKTSTQLQIFIWKGKDERGETVQGELEGLSIAAVKAYLRSQKIIPASVKKKPKSLFGGGKKIDSRDITIFTRQTATMLTSGIPLVQAFDIVAKGHPNKNMINLVEKIKADVEAGNNFTEALSHHPKYFSEIFINLVNAGEQSGALDKILDRLATYREKSDSIKGKIRKALFYPIAVMIVAVIVTSVILIYVVPQFQDLFKNFGAELPALTQIVLNMSDFMQNYWWLIFGICSAIGGAVTYCYKHFPVFVHYIDRMVLHVPIIGPILKKAAVARFARTLATTFSAGVPLVEGLKSVAKATGNIVYTNAINKINYDISQGKALQQAIKNTQIFPDMLTQMVAIGEESGELENMLNKVADFYEEEVDNAVDSLSSLIEPLIMAILGVIIGGLIIAMYMPVFELGSVV